MSQQALRWAWAQQPPLSATQKLVLLALAETTDKAPPTLTALASMTCLSKRAVINALMALERIGLIKKVVRQGYQTPLYLLVISGPVTNETDHPPIQEMHSPVHEMHPPVHDVHPPPVHEMHPPVHDVHPLPVHEMHPPVNDVHHPVHEVHRPLLEEVNNNSNYSGQSKGLLSPG